jgi:N-acetylglucosaminyldiphosphoundecaprenol N-acetyl-beta-D-mannosaminyltransferase
MREQTLRERMVLRPMVETTETEAVSDAKAAGGSRRHVALRGFPFLHTTEQGLVELVMRERGQWIITPNLDILRQGCQRPEIAALLRRADVLVADGMPLIWASRLQRTPLPERVSGSHIIWSIPEAAARHGKSIFLLGGAPGAAEACAKVLMEKFPSLRITGTYCPPFGFEKSHAEMERAGQAVAAAPADIVFVALSFPKGEHLIERIRGVAPKSWWIGVGISFSFVAGEVKKAPRWMQRAGLEWVHRLAQEPRRLARRYLIDGLPFAARLLGNAAWRGAFGRSGNS